MTIEDAFFLPGKGVVISGVNSLLDSQSAERIKSFIGARVRVTRAGAAELLVEVKDVAVGESLVGKKNISILVEDTDLTPFGRGGRVLTG